MIYTPRVVVEMLEHPLSQATPNRMVCTKILMEGHEISISMDSSHTTGDLDRSDIRVYVGEQDVTGSFLEDGEHMLAGDSLTLHRVMTKIQKAVTVVD